MRTAKRNEVLPKNLFLAFSAGIIFFESVYQPRNAVNKTQPNTIHKIRFITSKKLLHVSTLGCPLQEVF